MDIGSILIGLALLLLVGVFIGRPILVKGGLAVTAEDRQLSELQATRDRILNQVQELDMDYAMAKIIEVDYKRERQALMLHGTDVLKGIDSLVDSAPRLAVADFPEDEIEAAVAKLRGRTAPSRAGFCPSCGNEVQPGDAFCIRCGTQLKVTEIAE
jgi:hypothetical protein